MSSISRQEGLKSLYRGLVLRLARVASGQAIMWSVVLRIESFFEQRGIEDRRIEDDIKEFEKDLTRQLPTGILMSNNVQTSLTTKRNMRS